MPLPVDAIQLTRWMDGELTGSPLDGTDSVLLLATNQRPPAALAGRLRGEALLVEMTDADVQHM